MTPFPLISVEKNALFIAFPFQKKCLIYVFLSINNILRQEINQKQNFEEEKNLTDESKGPINLMSKCRTGRRRCLIGCPAMLIYSLKPGLRIRIRGFFKRSAPVLFRLQDPVFLDCRILFSFFKGRIRIRLNHNQASIYSNKISIIQTFI